MSHESKLFGPSIMGMLQKLKAIESITKNISNAQSIGYQREIPESISFKSVLSGVSDKVIMRDTTPGQHQKTSGNLDLAIEGNAYFLIDTKNGIIPTRNGRFQLNEKGLLSTLDGDEVIVIEKTDKPISLANSHDINIDQKGEIYIGTERYGRLALKIDDSKPIKIHQGFVEGSNVNLMSEMVSMAMAFRAFEAAEKTLGMELSIDRDLIEKYGRNV